jgi:hypothetical protein
MPGPIGRSQGPGATYGVLSLRLRHSMLDPGWVQGIADTTQP